MRNRLACVVDRALGTLGLFLIGLTAWAADRLESPTWFVVMAGRYILVAIRLIGRAVDRLPWSRVVANSAGPVGSARDLALP